MEGFVALVVFVAMWVAVASKGRQSGWGNLKSHMAGAGTGFFAVLIAVSIMQSPTGAPSPHPTPTTTASPVAATPQEVIRKIDSHISKVEVYPQADGKPLLLITYTDDTIWDDGSWMSGTGLALKHILEAIAKTHANEYSRVQVKFMVPTVDRYGNKSEGFAMRTEHTMDDLRKVNWDNSSGFMMLDLAEAEIKPLGLAGFRDYCAEYGEYARTFCARDR